MQTGGAHKVDAAVLFPADAVAMGEGDIRVVEQHGVLLQQRAATGGDLVPRGLGQRPLKGNVRRIYGGTGAQAVIALRAQEQRESLEPLFDYTRTSEYMRR